MADMAERGAERRPPLITSARFGRSLDLHQRTTRYLITMGFRVVCFIAGALSPMPWAIVLLLAAAILPSIAVLLANAVDRRSAVEPALLSDDTDRRALPSGEIIPGEVEPRLDEEGAA